MTIKIKKLQTTWIMLVEEFQKVFTIELKFSFIFVLNFQIFLCIFIIFIYLNNIFSDNIPKKTIINFFYFSNK